jgi:hypothetical protein
MKKAILGLAAGVALAGLGGNAGADDTNAIGSSSVTMKKDTTTSLADSQELTGRVVKADANTVWIEHMGAVIALKIDANTRFDSASIPRARDLKEGQEIRASFLISNHTDNLAKSISLSPASGGSGLDTGTNPGSNTGAPNEKPY